MREELIRKKMIVYFGISEKKNPIFVFPVNNVVTLVLFLEIKLHKCTFLLVFLA